MNIDFVPWVIRSLLIIVGVILVVMIWKGKKAGRYQEYSLRFFTIGITAFIMGIILLVVSSITDLLFDYSPFLTITGAIAITIGLVIRNIWEKS